MVHEKETEVVLPRGPVAGGKATLRQWSNGRDILTPATPSGRAVETRDSAKSTTASPTATLAVAPATLTVEPPKAYTQLSVFPLFELLVRTCSPRVRDTEKRL